jgi:hypothetical protein
MKSESFTGVVQSGHKQDAVEVPFDPAKRWGMKVVSVVPGRRGFAVRGTVGGVEFNGYVVARSKRFWLLLEPALEHSAQIRSGSTIEVTLHGPSQAD